MTARPEGVSDEVPAAAPPRFGSRLRQVMIRPFKLSEAEATFAVRGFRASDAEVRQRLERIGATFICAYNCALASESVLQAIPAVEEAGPGFKGFAAEGAAMGAAIADALSLRAGRLAAWMQWAGDRFTYLAHVGAGWALGRVPWRKRAILGALDPIHSWLAYDGLGFHDAFFRGRRVLAGWRRLRDGYACRAYDQGVGRALWFLFGGDAQPAARWITQSPRDRQGDLWSGLGLAVSYAGGASALDFAMLVRQAAGDHIRLAQGAAFAAEAHTRSGEVPDWCSQAVRQLTGRELPQAVTIVRRARALIESQPAPIPRYELWRLAVQRSLADCPA